MHKKCIRKSEQTLGLEWLIRCLSENVLLLRFLHNYALRLHSYAVVYKEAIITFSAKLADEVRYPLLALILPYLKQQKTYNYVKETSK